MKTCETQMEELNTLRVKIESLEKEQVSLKALNNNVMVSLKKARANLKSKDEELARIQQENLVKSDVQNLEEFRTEIENLKSEINKYKHDNSDMYERLNQFENLQPKVEELEAAQTLNLQTIQQLKSQADQFTIVKEEKLNLENLLKENDKRFKDQIENLESELSALKNDKSKLEEEGNLCNMKLKDLQQKLDESLATITDLNKKIQNVQEEKSQDTQFELDTLKKELKATQSEIQSKLGVIQNEKLNLENLLKENEKISKDQIVSHDSVKLELEKEIQRLNLELNQTKDQQQQLNEIEAEKALNLKTIQQLESNSLKEKFDYENLLKENEIRLRNQIESLESELSNLKSDQLQIEAEKALNSKTIQDLESELSKLSIKLEENDRRFKDQMESLESELSTLRNEKLKLKEDISSISAQNGNFSEEIKQLNIELDQTKDFQQKIVEIEAEQALNTKTIQQLESNSQMEKLNYENSLNENRNQIENLESELSHLKSDKLQRLQQKLDEIEIEKASNLKTIQDLESELSNLKKENSNSLQQKLDEIEAEKALNLKTIQDLESELSKLSIKLEENDRRYGESLESELSTLKIEKLKLEEDISGLIAQHKNSNEEIKQLNIQLNETKNLQKTLDEKDMNLKQIEQLKSEIQEEKLNLERNFKNQTEILETEITNLKKEKSDWEEEMKLLNIQLDQTKGMQQQINEIEAEKTLSLQTIQQLKSEADQFLITKEENEKISKVQIDSLESKISSLEERFGKQLDELKVSDQQNKDLHKQLEEIVAEKALQSQTIQGLELELSNFMSTQSKLEECMMTILNLNIQLQQVQEEKINLEQLYEEDKLILNKLKSESDELETLKNEHIEMSKQILELTQKLSDSQAANQNHSNELKQSNEQLKNVPIDLNSANEKLEEALKDYKSSIQKLKAASNQRYSKLKKKFTTAVQALNVISSSMLLLGGAQAKSESSHLDALLTHLSASKAEQTEPASSSTETSLVEQEPILEFSFDELEFKKCIESKLEELQAKSEWLVTIEKLQVAAKNLTNELDASKQEIKHLSDKLSHTEVKSKVGKFY